MSKKTHLNLFFVCVYFTDFSFSVFFSFLFNSTEFLIYSVSWFWVCRIILYIVYIGVKNLEERAYRNPKTKKINNTHAKNEEFLGVGFLKQKHLAIKNRHIAQISKKSMQINYKNVQNRVRTEEIWWFELSRGHPTKVILCHRLIASTQLNINSPSKRSVKLKGHLNSN